MPDYTAPGRPALDSARGSPSRLRRRAASRCGSLRRLGARRRERRHPSSPPGRAPSVAYAVASAALAAGAAGGWHDATFRVYYLFGGLLTVPLLGAGSLLRIGARWAVPGAPVTGLAIGVMRRCPFARRRQRHRDSKRAGAPRLPARACSRSRQLGPDAGSRRRRTDRVPPAPARQRTDPRRSRAAAFGSALTGFGEAGTSLFRRRRRAALRRSCHGARWGDRRAASEGSASLPG